MVIASPLDHRYTGLIDCDAEMRELQDGCSIHIRIEVRDSHVHALLCYSPASSGQVIDHGAVKYIVAHHFCFKSVELPPCFLISKVRTMDWRKDPKPITRSKLVMEIAKSLKLLINARLVTAVLNLTVSSTENAS